MTFYVRLLRRHCRPVLRYPVELPVEIFDSVRIENAEFALAFTLPGAVILCEANQLDKWMTLVAEFTARENATDARPAPPADNLPPAGAEGGS
jgi:hypothetical protein